MQAPRLASWLFETTGSLTQRTARAGLWLAIGDGCARIASVAKIIVLARLLAPSEFGVMGVALLVTTWVQYFSELGFNAALIHKQDDIRPYLDTAWTIQLFRSAGMAVLVILGAPVAGWAFNEPMAVPVLQVLALEIAIRGMANPAVVYLRKDLDTRREVAWRMAGMVAGLVVGVPAAFVLRNVWALVLSLIAATIADTIMSYWVKPYRPSLHIDWAKGRELVLFGRWIFFFRTAGFFTSNLDNLVVGKVLGATALGLYQMALQVAVVPTSTFGVHLHGVMFPAFSSIPDESTRRVALVRSLTIVSAIVIPIGLFMTVFGDLLVDLLLGRAWVGIEPVIELLAWVGVMRALMTVISAFLLAVGRPDLDFRAKFPELGILVLFLYPAIVADGIVGVALVLLLATVATLAYQLRLLLRITTFSVRDFASILRGGVLGSLPFAISWLAVVLLSSLSVPMLAVASAAAYLVMLTIAVQGELSRPEPAVTPSAVGRS